MKIRCRIEGVLSRLTGPNEEPPAEVKTERAADLRKPFEGIRGCGDHSCLIETPDDLGTNGGCRCHNDRTKASIIVQRLAFLRRQAEEDDIEGKMQDLLHQRG